MFGSGIYWVIKNVMKNVIRDDWDITIIKGQTSTLVVKIGSSDVTITGCIVIGTSI